VRSANLRGSGQWGDLSAEEVALIPPHADLPAALPSGRWSGSVGTPWTSAAHTLPPAPTNCTSPNLIDWEGLPSDDWTWLTDLGCGTGAIIDRALIERLAAAAQPAGDREASARYGVTPARRAPGGHPLQHARGYRGDRSTVGDTRRAGWTRYQRLAGTEARGHSFSADAAINGDVDLSMCGQWAKRSTGFGGMATHRETGRSLTARCQILNTANGRPAHVGGVLPADR